MPRQPRAARPEMALIEWKIGCICVYLALVLTIICELGAVDYAKTYTRIVFSVNEIPDITRVDEKLYSSLVYLTGPLQINESLTEPGYGISVPAVQLKRSVEMYQWAEKRIMSKITYDCEWRAELIDSSKFIFKEGHGNPKYFPIKSTTYTSKTVMIGAYILGDDLKKRLETSTTITNTQKPEKNDTKLHDGKFYHSKNVSNPQVGDIRVEFSIAGLVGAQVSVIAYQSSSNKLFMNRDDPILFIAEGTVLPETLAQNKDKRSMWYIRFSRALGWILFYGGGIFLKDNLLEFRRRHPSRFIQLCLTYMGSVEVSFANVCFAYLMSALWSNFNIFIGVVVFFCFLRPTFIPGACVLLECLEG